MKNSILSSVQCQASSQLTSKHLSPLSDLFPAPSSILDLGFHCGIARIISNRNFSWASCARNSIFKQWKVQNFTFDMRQKLLSALLDCSLLLDSHFVWEWNWPNLLRTLLLSWDIHLFWDITHGNVIHQTVQCLEKQYGEMRKIQVTVTTSWAASPIPGTLLILPFVLEPSSQQGFSDQQKVTRSF